MVIDKKKEDLIKAMACLDVYIKATQELPDPDACEEDTCTVCMAGEGSKSLVFHKKEMWSEKRGKYLVWVAEGNESLVVEKRRPSVGDGEH